MTERRAAYRTSRQSVKPDLVNALITQARIVGLPAPETEYRFHPTRKWRLDIAWPDLMIAVEVQGGVWSGGRHVRGAGYEADCEKANAAALAGWLLLRVTGGMIERGEAIKAIEQAFHERR